MTLDKLRQLELSIMREAFDLACRRAGLGVAAETADEGSLHAELASIIQTLVERGFTDVELIADSANKALKDSRERKRS